MKIEKMIFGGENINNLTREEIEMGKNCGIQIVDTKFEMVSLDRNELSKLGDKRTLELMKKCDRFIEVIDDTDKTCHRCGYKTCRIYFSDETTKYFWMRRN